MGWRLRQILELFNRRQIISIEWATTPHSFNSLLLLLLLILPLLLLPSSISMRFLFWSLKSMHIFYRWFQCISNALIFAITVNVSFYLGTKGFLKNWFWSWCVLWIQMYYFRGNILFYLNEVELRSMRFDFEHQRGNFGHQRVAFVSLEVDC